MSPIELIATPILNVSYERLINQDSGIGVNGIFFLEDEDSKFTQISPYYRAYFGKKYASGFFAEAFVPITMRRDIKYHYDNKTATEKEIKDTTLGLGVGFGGKWVAKKNIVFEASIGIARKFGADDYFEDLTGKGMLGIGYRF